MRIVIALMLCLFAGISAAEEMRLQFDPPTERRDGSSLDPATEISEYTVYCRAGDADWPSTGYTIPGLTDAGVHETTFEALLAQRGRYECVMTATDTDGRESGHSNTVDVSWLSPPGEPTNVIIVRE